MCVGLVASARGEVRSVGGGVAAAAVSKTGWVTHQHIRIRVGSVGAVSGEIPPLLGGVCWLLVSRGCLALPFVSSSFFLGWGRVVSLSRLSVHTCIDAIERKCESVRPCWWWVSLWLVPRLVVGSEKMHSNRMRLLRVGCGGSSLTPSAACLDGW